jgi:hypothetical protein
MKRIHERSPRGAEEARKPDVLPDYDFSGGARGKHIGRYPGHAAALVQQAQEAADLPPRLRRLWLDDLRAAYAGDPRQAAILAAVELLWAAKAQQDTVCLALAHAFGESKPMRRGRTRRAV